MSDTSTPQASPEVRAELIRAAKSKVYDTVAGQGLAALMRQRIAALESDSRSRADIVEALANAAGIKSGTVNQIIKQNAGGRIDCPPIERLRGFAGVLGLNLSTLQRAAEADGCSYGDD